jgi:hypothetical protein
MGATQSSPTSKSSILSVGENTTSSKQFDVRGHLTNLQKLIGVDKDIAAQRKLWSSITQVADNGFGAVLHTAASNDLTQTAISTVASALGAEWVGDIANMGLQAVSEWTNEFADLDAWKKQHSSIPFDKYSLTPEDFFSRGLQPEKDWPSNLVEGDRQGNLERLGYMVYYKKDPIRLAYAKAKSLYPALSENDLVEKTREILNATPTPNTSGTFFKCRSSFHLLEKQSRGLSDQPAPLWVWA